MDTLHTCATPSQRFDTSTPLRQVVRMSQRHPRVCLWSISMLTEDLLFFEPSKSMRTTWMSNIDTHDDRQMIRKKLLTSYRDAHDGLHACIRMMDCYI